MKTKGCCCLQGVLCFTKKQNVTVRVTRQIQMFKKGKNGPKTFGQKSEQPFQQSQKKKWGGWGGKSKAQTGAEEHVQQHKFLFK